MGHHDLMLRVLEGLNREPRACAPPSARRTRHGEDGRGVRPAARLAVAIGPTDETVPFVLRGLRFAGS